VYLPLLVLPATTGPPAAAAVSTATAVAQLLAAAVRTPAQVALVTAWVPPAARASSGVLFSPVSPVFSHTSPVSAGPTTAGGGVVPRSKRGWEKTAVPGAGGVPCVVRYLLALLAGGAKDNKVRDS
jgi:hypothetical protein